MLLFLGAKAIIQHFWVEKKKEKKEEEGDKIFSIVWALNYFFRCINVKKKNHMQAEICIFWSGG